MNRMLFYTMGVGDMKDDQFLFYGEAFKAYRGEGEKSGKEKRIVIFGKGDSLTEAVKEMRNSVNYPIEYAGNKSFVFTKNLAEEGVGNILDIFGRDQKPSLRIYLLVFDGEADDLLNITMNEEQFMGLYLYEMMNSQKTTIGVITNQYYQFVENLQTGGSINVVPILTTRTIEDELKESSKQPKEQGEQSKASSSQSGSGSSSSGDGENHQDSGSKPLSQPYVAIDGAAVFVNDKMVTALSAKELETYKLMTRPVNSGLIDTANPDVQDKKVGFSMLSNKYKSDVAIVDGHVKLNYSLNIRVVFLEAQDGISSSGETVQKLNANLKETVEKRAAELFEKMKKQKIDLFDVKRKLELARLKPDSDDFLDDIDFHIDVHVTIDGLGELKEAYY